jgi:hypothetical protein
MKTIRKIVVCASVALVAMSAAGQAQNGVSIPDIPGYKTLKCDFHIHTVFSDGTVWPTVRVDEAIREELDAISITEHIEFRPNHISGDIVSTHDRSYEIAAEAVADAAEERKLVLIRGSEITRSMAPGHSNAIFLKVCDSLDRPEWRDSYAEAKRQGAFIFWNHPSWQAQQPHETLWWPEHTEIFENGWMDGIEVVNGCDYSPEAHQWSLDRNLTMLGTSDAHDPIRSLDPAKGEHRTMTLVFARDNTPVAIREALDARRTVVYYGNTLIGRRPLLQSIFDSAIELVKIHPSERRMVVEYRNLSGLTFELRRTGDDPEFDYMRQGRLTVKPHECGVFVIRFPEGKHGNVGFEVTNFLVAPGRGLDVSYEL